MATCPECRKYFRTPDGEEQDHACPRCGYFPEKEMEDDE